MLKYFLVNLRQPSTISVNCTELKTGNQLIAHSSLASQQRTPAICHTTIRLIYLLGFLVY